MGFYVIEIRSLEKPLFVYVKLCVYAVLYKWLRTLPCSEVKELVLADRKLVKVCESSISC